MALCGGQARDEQPPHPRPDDAPPPRDPADLLEAVLALDLPDLVVVDNTASAAVAATVVEAVRRGVAAVCRHTTVPPPRLR